MSKVKGISVMVPPFIIAIVEFYYLIIQPLMNKSNVGSFELSSTQYWALALPVAVSMIIVSLMAAWIGWTMIITPEPIRLTYEEAYEEATEEENNENKN